MSENTEKRSERLFFASRGSRGASSCWQPMLRGIILRSVTCRIVMRDQTEKHVQARSKASGNAGKAGKK